MGQIGFRSSAVIAAAVLVGFLAGCSGPQQQPTAAIAPAGQTDAAVAKATDQAAAGATDASAGANADAAAMTDVGTVKSKQQAALAGFTVPVDKLDCEQMSAEMDLFKQDSTIKKLAEFGKAKYQPTPEESAKFTRLVAVKAAIGERCKPVKKARVKLDPKKAAQVAPAAATTGGKPASRRQE